MANIKVTQIDFSTVADAKVLDTLGKKGRAISKNLDQIVKAKGTLPWLYPDKGKDDGVVRDKKSLRIYTGNRGWGYALLLAANRLKWPACTIHVYDLGDVSYAASEGAWLHAPLSSEMDTFSMSFALG